MRTFFATCGALALMIPVGLLPPENTNAQEGFRRGNRRTIQTFTRVQNYNFRNARRPESRNNGRCGIENCGLAGCSPCRKPHRDFCDSPTFDGPRFGNPRNLLPPPRFEPRSRPRTLSHQGESNRRSNDKLSQSKSPRREDSRKAPIARQEIKWQTDLRTARRESSETGLPILVKFSASWCGPCKRMKAETFTDASLTRMINECFIPVAVDTDQHEQLARQLRIETVPTTMVIAPNGNIIARREGFQSAAQLSRAIARFCKPPGGHPIVSNERRSRFGR